MRLSTHVIRDNEKREAAIAEIGLGTPLYINILFDEKRGRKFIYEVSSTAILTIRAFDDYNLIISRYPARPSRIRKCWEDAPQEIIDLSIKHTRQGLTF